MPRQHSGSRGPDAVTAVLSANTRTDRRLIRSALDAGVDVLGHVASAPLQGAYAAVRLECLPGLVLEADPCAGQRLWPRTFAQVAVRQAAIASSSRSKAWCAGTCGLNLRLRSKNDTPRSV
jgi:hypothetical protein